MFIRLLASIVSASNHTKCLSLNNHKCMTQPIVSNLHPKEYSQELHYFPFTVSLDRCVGSCNTINDFSNKVCVLNKTEDLNLSLFNMITGINQSKILTKHVSCKCKCKLDGRECNSNQKWNKIGINVDVSVKIWENIIYVKKIIFWILLHVVAKVVNI